MERYNIINLDNGKITREIVLLKSFPCSYGKCSFCDYILDNSTNEEEMIKTNKNMLKNITGEFGVIEIINSGNVFDLPAETIKDIKNILVAKDIKTIFVESHFMYKTKIKEIRDYFAPTKVIVKTGLESFNNEFREDILNKGFKYKNIKELNETIDSVCLMVGIKGQTKEMIVEDIELAMQNFAHFTVNVYVNNSTNIVADKTLIEWFNDNYQWLNDEKRCDILWNNTDFGVGE